MVHVLYHRAPRHNLDLPRQAHTHNNGAMWHEAQSLSTDCNRQLRQRRIADDHHRNASTSVTPLIHLSILQLPRTRAFEGDLRSRLRWEGTQWHRGRCLEQYFGFFNVTDDQRDSPYAKNVGAKFRAHDINGDGMLTFDEVQLACDEDGCN